ncbi:hypothetical protein HHX38_28720 [Streptomyces sp. PKU-MA01144]|uniref:hypothetical protein n=1 Tax=Streptomyces sp. PKU-MA01144 TaxID=2729138 RepID=UPI00147BF4F1|nr:hypothetical protein [Streptomyces sp. PKU-MA01144]NNJ08083.1 hypothetical protein [Streptomyces sp. PKU-MA01144]
MDSDFGTIPGAQDMRDYVTRFVAQLTERNRLPLDYSVSSLRIVDFLVDGLRRGGPERAQVEGVLRGLGGYVGEVMVRRAGGRWVDFDSGQREFFEQPVGVRMPDGRAWNPLGKVVNRFEAGGPEESVQRLYLQLHGRSAGRTGGTRRSGRTVSC